MQATVPVTLNAYSAGQPDRLGVTEPSYDTTGGLYAYWLLSAPTITDPVTGTYIETAQLGVPPTFPAVQPGDLITVADRVWEINGHPVDYSLGPFSDQWVAVTGEKPATVIHLRRAANVEEGS